MISRRVWDLDGNENAIFRLRSPGISVCWHPEEVFKVGAVNPCMHIGQLIAKHLSDCDDTCIEKKRFCVFQELVSCRPLS